jgi:hypothetical protein
VARFGKHLEIESDADVIKSFAAADEFFEIHQDKLKRPSLLLHVAKDPNAPPPLPTPTYLEEHARPCLNNFNDHAVVLCLPT